MGQSGHSIATQEDGDFVPKWSGVLIDLDGTLVDSVPDLAIAANLMLVELGLPQKAESEIRKWVGNGVTRLVERALTGDFNGQVDEVECQQAQTVFLRHYAEHLCDKSQCYPGVREGLERLAARGVGLACVTNKPEAYTRPLLERLGLLDRFQVVVGGDTLAEKKPHPAPILHAAAGLGLDIKHCVLIGDSLSDIKSAQNAGCVCVCVRYGYNQGLDLSTYQPNFLVDDFESAIHCIFQS